jgi:hypothetical protein
LSKDARQFFQFLCAVLGLGLIGGLFIKSNPSPSLALPVGIAWIIVFLGTVGFIFAGKEGANDLISRTVLTWGAMILCAAFITWLVIASAGHNL